MTLKSALQDLRETTLAAVAGLLAKLAYLASLRGPRGRLSALGYVAGAWARAFGSGSEAAHGECLAAFLGLRSIHWWKICGIQPGERGLVAKHMSGNVRAVE